MNVKNSTQLLISVSDPLLMYFRILNWRARLNPLFDNLFIAVSEGPDRRDDAELKIVRDFFTGLSANDPAVTFDFLEPTMANHGVNIRYLLEKHWAEIRDTILIMEDDDFILNADLLQRFMSRIGSNDLDVVGATRGCTNNEHFISFERQIMQEDNLFENLRPFTFPHFQPTTLLIRKSCFNPNDILEAHSHMPGDQIVLRGRPYTFEIETAMDTFVKFSSELLNRINKAHDLQTYAAGTPTYEDQFAYYFHGGYHDRNWHLQPNPQALMLQQFQYHIGSASCLYRFAFKQTNLLEQSIFSEMDHYIKDSGYHSTVLEIYRRYYVYKLIFDVVKNNAEFAQFVPAYEENFAITDDYFLNKMKIDDLMDASGNSIFDKNVYTDAFKHIAGV